MLRAVKADLKLFNAGFVFMAVFIWNERKTRGRRFTLSSFHIHSGGLVKIKQKNKNGNGIKERERTARKKKRQYNNTYLHTKQDNFNIQLEI